MLVDVADDTPHGVFPINTKLFARFVESNPEPLIVTDPDAINKFQS